MPRQRNLAPPSYCRHKGSGQAVVRIKGKDHYLGAYGSPESHEAYGRLISEWRLAETDRQVAASLVPKKPQKALTITEVVYLYREFATTYYCKDGVPTKELAEMKLALRP